MGKEQGAGSFKVLESLSISGFRGIDHLTIPRLGRVALIAGKNGIGKTTVLEALSVYAARGRLRALREILTRRDEWTSFSEVHQDSSEVHAFDRLFYQNEDSMVEIAVGPSRDGPIFRMDEVEDFSAIPTEIADDVIDGRYGEEPRVLRLAFGGTVRFYVRDDDKVRVCRGQGPDFPGSQIKCRWVGPQIVSNRQLANFWDQAVRENLESLALGALRLVYGSEVERAPVMVGDSTDRRPGRRAVVKLRHHALPVPLRSLGDGATRMFGVALALANCRDGILLIDEVENGIHYSLHSKFWSMILRTAETHNTQVLATTHSKDCIDGFAEAALANPNVDANFVRIGRRNGKLRAVGYSIEELETVAEQNFEVR